MRRKMAEGMEVEAAPAIRDKKRFEVKKVSKWLPSKLQPSKQVRTCAQFTPINALSIFILVECCCSLGMG